MHFTTRRTNLQDPSPNDIIRKCGVHATDCDMELYHPTTFDTLGRLEFKHWNGKLDLHKNSIKYLQHKSNKELVPFFVLITFTKPNEQPHDMFYVIPLNGIAELKIVHLHVSIPHKQTGVWMTPRAWARFECRFCGVEITSEIEREHNKLSDDYIEYISKLPQIIY